MNYRMEFGDDVMLILDAENNGHDAMAVNPDKPWDAIDLLTKWGRRYELDACDALRELRRYLKDSR